MRLSTLSTGCFFCGFCPPVGERRRSAHPGSLRRDALHHGLHGIAVSAQMEPGWISDPGDQVSVRAQSRRDEECFTGKVFPAGQAAAFQCPFPMNRFNGPGTDEPDGELCQTTPISGQSAAGVLLLHQRDGDTQRSDLGGHDEADIAAAQDHHRPFRAETVKIHHFLHLPRRVDAPGPGSGNG